ncbi:MAG: aliphatic sulfonate ABC transporter substrate-binding protein [Solirubrobacterales bacterium]|nr:aliphatic sulfonate ABC transporter substrate-binding protein [Solirubrobacterales bacterium]
MNTSHPNTSIRNLRLLLVLAMIVAAFGLIACGSDDSSDSGTDDAAAASAPADTASSDAPSEIRIGYQLIPNGDLIVKNEGWLEDAFPDSTIKWVKFDSGGDVNTAVAAGSIDIGLAGSAPVSNGVSSGIAYKVPWIHDVIGDAESLAVKSDSGVTDVAGLKGKTIATPLASTAHYSLLTAIKNAGLQPSDVKVVDLEPDAILAAWTRGDVDGAYVWNPTLAELVKDGGTIIESSANLAKQGALTADLAVVTDDFAGQYPDAVQTWVDTQNKAVELYKSDPQAAAKAIATELSISPKEALEQTKGLEFLTAQEQSAPEFLGTEAAPGKLADALQSTAQFLADLGQLEGQVQPGLYKDALAPQYVNAVTGG